MFVLPRLRRPPPHLEPPADVVLVVERQVVAGQVEEAVEEHPRVPGGKDEAVTVGPVGVAGIVAEEARPEDVGHWLGIHRHPRVTGVSLLDRVHAQGAAGVDAEIIEFDSGVRHRMLLQRPPLIYPRESSDACGPFGAVGSVAFPLEEARSARCP